MLLVSMTPWIALGYAIASSSTICFPKEGPKGGMSDENKIPNYFNEQRR